MAVKFLGMSDDVTTCGCCGRVNLKRTVALSFDDADATYYGTTCAAHALRMPAAEVKRAAKAADDAREAEEQKARKAAFDAEFKAFRDKIDRLVPQLRGNYFRQLETLGGLRAARVAVSTMEAAS